MRIRVGAIGLVMAAGVLLGACGKGTGDGLGEATGKASGRVVKVAEGEEWARANDREGMKVDFVLGDGAGATVFATVGEVAAADPVIVRKEKGVWRVGRFGEEMRQQTWFAVLNCEARHEWWGVLDTGTDSKSGQLTLVRSTDGGETWGVFSAVKEVCPQAEYESFRMDEAGHGTMTVQLNEDEGDLKAGLYHYVTGDGGRTWRGPTYEADEMEEIERSEGEKVGDVIKGLDGAGK